MAAGLLSTIEHYAAPEGLTVWRLGGPSVALRTPQTLIYLDLFTGPSPIAELHKATTDVIDPAAARRADAALSTHHDIDHCHEGSVRALLAGTPARFVGPASCQVLFKEWGLPPERCTEVAAGDSLALNDLRISALPCNDYFDAQAVSYLLESGGVTIFTAGDSLFYSEFRDIGARYKVDAALLNFARNPPGEIYYMNAAHVARTAEDVGARLVVPMHYDLWAEFLDEPAQLEPLLTPKGIGLECLEAGQGLSLTTAGHARLP